MAKTNTAWVLYAVLCVAASAVAVVLILTRAWWHAAAAAFAVACLADEGIRRFHPDGPKRADHG